LANTWWALHSIECILTSITGRPRIIAGNDCTVPLPSNGNTVKGDRKQKEKIRSESSSVPDWVAGTGLPRETAMDLDQFSKAYTELDILQHKSLSNLYSARTAIQSWQHMQEEILMLSTELDDWALRALSHVPFGETSTAKPSLGREQLLLYFYYQSVKICITRPCLCRLDRRNKGQSDDSANFNQNTARACVQAALDLGSLLPEPPNPQWIYSNGPWWACVHFSKIPSLLWSLIEV
jgi:hypothetical protein